MFKKIVVGILFFAIIAVFFSTNILWQKKINPRLPTNESTQNKVTDIHSHVACPMAKNLQDDGMDCYVNEAMRKSFKFPLYLKAFGVTEQELQQFPFQIVDLLAAKIKNSQRMGRAVILAMDGWIDPDSGRLDPEKTQFYVPNKFVKAAVKRYEKEGIFLYGASINPNRHNAIEQLEQAKKDGAVLIKWIPSVMNIDPADSRYTKFYQKMRELNIPLLVHTGDEATFAWANNPLCDPMKLTLPLDLGVKVIAAHVATSGVSDKEPNNVRLRRLFAEKKYEKNLFAEISGTTLYNRVKRFNDFIRDPNLRGRLMFGTDWPLIDVTILDVHVVVPYKLFPTDFFDALISWQEARELDEIPNSFDKDIRLKEMLGASPEIFQLADEVLLKKLKNN